VVRGKRPVVAVEGAEGTRPGFLGQQHRGATTRVAEAIGAVEARWSMASGCRWRIPTTKVPLVGASDRPWPGDRFPSSGSRRSDGWPSEQNPGAEAGGVHQQQVRAFPRSRRWRSRGRREWCTVHESAPAGQSWYPRSDVIGADTSSSSDLADSVDGGRLDCCPCGDFLETWATWPSSP